MNVNTTMMEIPVPWPDLNWSRRPGDYADEPGVMIGFLQIQVNSFNFAMQMPDWVIKELGHAAVYKILQEAIKQAQESWGEAFKVACLSIDLAYWRRRRETLNKMPDAFNDTERQQIMRGLAHAVGAMIDPSTQQENGP